MDLKSVLDIEPPGSTIAKRLERQPCIVVPSVGFEIGPSLKILASPHTGSVTQFPNLKNEDKPHRFTEWDK